VDSAIILGMKIDAGRYKNYFSSSTNNFVIRY
jgi:hypothetical protein